MRTRLAFSLVWLLASCAMGPAYSTPTNASIYQVPQVGTASDSIALAGLEEEQLAVSELPANSAEDGGVISVPTPQKDKRKVIHEASITLRVRDVAKVQEEVEEIARKLDGFVLSSSQSGEKRSVTLRVPDANLDLTLEGIGALGKVVSRSVRGQDVTDQYRDLTIRLDSSQKLLARYHELLSAADNVDSMLAIEKEIGRITQEIEQIKGILIYLEDKTSLATVHVSIEKKHTPGPIGAVFYGLGWALSKLFVLN